MFIVLLSVCTTACLGEQLASNSEGSAKCVSLKYQHVKLDQHLSI